MNNSNVRPANQQQGQEASNIEGSQQQGTQGSKSSKVIHEGRTMTLSEAASIMRNATATPEEKSLAASIMGREGGKHSHDHDRGRKKASGE